MTNSSHDIIEGFDLYYTELRARKFENYELLVEEHTSFFSVIKEVYDVQQRIFRHYFTLMLSDYDKNLPSRKILTAAYIKGMYSLFTATELIFSGFFGSARILLRQVFEFLIIAKYSSVTNDTKFINHWENGGHVGIGKQVLRKIKTKELESLNRFWEDLCDFNHATSFSQQLGVKYDDVKAHTIIDLSAIIVLLNCNYHLLTRHLIDSKMKYYANRLFKEDVIEAKRNSATVMKASKAILSKQGLGIIRAYSSNWIF